MALGLAPLLDHPPVLEGPGPLDTHAAVEAAVHNLEVMALSAQAHNFPEAPAWGGLASARELNKSTTNLSTPHMSYRDGSTTPSAVFRQTSVPGYRNSSSTTTTVVTRMETPRGGGQLTPRMTPRTHVRTSSREVPTVPAGARTPQLTPRGATTPPFPNRSSSRDRVGYSTVSTRSMTPSRSVPTLHPVTTTSYTFVNPPKPTSPSS